MKVLRIQPKKYPEVIEIDGSLESLQKEVAGPIQAVYPWDDPVALICNEEGKLAEDSFSNCNRVLHNEIGIPYDIVVGTFLIVGLTEDDFSDLSQELIQTKSFSITRKSLITLRMLREEHIWTFAPVNLKITRNNQLPLQMHESFGEI